MTTNAVNLQYRCFRLAYGCTCNNIFTKRHEHNKRRDAASRSSNLLCVRGGLPQGDEWERETQGSKDGALGNRRPGHGDENSRLHVLDQRHCLVDSVAPALDRPALLASLAALLEVGKLPEMVDRVEVADLDEPGADALHDFTTSLEATTPVRLPLEQVSRVQRVRSELENTAELSGRSCGPEGKLLHQRHVLTVDERVELAVEFGEAGIMRDGVSRLVVTLVLLVFPDVNYRCFG